MQDFCFARKIFGEDFLYERHVNYLLKSLRKSTYGCPLEVAEAHRLSSLFFVVSGLDLLGALDTRLTPADKGDIIHWIYSHQVNVNSIFIPDDLIKSSDEIDYASLIAEHKQGEIREEIPQHLSRMLNNNINNGLNNYNTNNTHIQKTNTNDSHHIYGPYHNNNHNQGDNLSSLSQQQSPLSQRGKHIHLSKKTGHAGFRATSMINSDIPFDFGVLPMTYCALATLIILGDDLKRVDKKSVLDGMRQLQLPDGSFKPTIFGGETDMRLVYCAAAVSQLLNDWSGMDKERCAQFIKSSLSYEGAFGQCPGAEAHGGSTFCALASLKLMSKLDDTLSKSEIDKLIRWCLMRFENGFCGRPNKDEDTCYSFWIGACLIMLDHFQFVDQKNLLDFILLAQEERGGLAKVPDFYSDPIHTYLGFAGLTFINEDLCSKRGVNLQKLDPTLNISARARAHLDRLHGVTKQSDLSQIDRDKVQTGNAGGLDDEDSGKDDCEDDEMLIT